ncbi:MAG TPA: hypothetical protein PKA59_06420, partial [Chakrabartia sp.]|nr:hypothetical protein [Chakrabartia sp.]
KTEPQTVTIPAGGAVPVSWTIKAPDAAGAVTWEIEAKGGKATDRMSFVQDVVPAVPVEVWAATLTRVGANTSVPLLAPAGALPGYGFVDVKLSDTLAPPLAGVRAYMGDYPYDCVEQQTSRFVVRAIRPGGTYSPPNFRLIRTGTGCCVTGRSSRWTGMRRSRPISSLSRRKPAMLFRTKAGRRCSAR